MSNSPNFILVILRTFTSLRRPVRLTLAVALVTSTLVLGVPSLSGTPAQAAAGGLATRYVPIAPIRVLDTRASSALQPDRFLDLAPIDAAVSAAISAQGVDPKKVEAVAINLTAIGTFGPGYLTAWPTGLNRPNVSSLNYQTGGAIVPNLVIVPLGTDGKISIYSLSGTNLSVDVQGVFERADSSIAGRFVPIDPDRAIDTRESTPIGAEKSIVVDLTGQIPASASAAVLNIAATETAGPGFLTVWTAGVEARPLAANLNYPAANYTVANSVITGVNDGKVSIFSLARAEVIVDVVGYMTGDTDSTGDISAGLYVPLPPQRLYDSRHREAPCRTPNLGAGRIFSLPVAGELRVPGSGFVSAVTMNLTMTNTLQAGFLEAFPADTTRPDPYSSVNAVRSGQTVGNHAVVAINAGGIDLFSSNGTDFIADITGYFLHETGTPPTTAIGPAPQPDENCNVPVPPANNDYGYLQAAGQEGKLAPYSRNGVKYFGWRPCHSITYAVNTERATKVQIDAMNTAIRQVEYASGFDFILLGDVNGSLNTDNIDANVPGVGQAMAVIAFSDSTATPILSGGVIGIGGIGAGSGENLVQDGSLAWIVRGGFALADIDDVTEPGDITATFAHELGHLIGLAHVNAADELMRPALTSQTDYGDGDRNGLYNLGEPQCALYRALGSRTSAALSTDAPASFTVTGWIADEHIDH
jgi:hypothetical protein